MDINDKRYLFTKDKPRVKFYSFTYFADCYDSNGDCVSTVENNLKKIKTDNDYYKYVTNEIVRKFDHPVNIWYYPCAYNAEPYTYEKCGEDYCVA